MIKRLGQARDHLSAELVAVLAGLGIAFFSGGMLAPILPIFVSGKGVAAGTFGLVFSVMAVAIAVGEVCWGWTTDRVDLRVPLVAGTLGLGLATATFLVAQSVPIFFLAFVISGLFRPIMPVVSRWYTGTHAPPHFRGSAMALITAAMWGAQGLVGFAGCFVAEAWGQAATVAMAGALAVLPGIAFLVGTRRLDFCPPSQGEDVGLAGASRPSHSNGTMISHTLLLGAVAATFFISFATISAFLPLFATQVVGTSPSLVGVLFGMRGLVQLLAVFPFARLADRNGKRAFVVAGLLGMALSMAGVGLSKDLWWLVVSVVLLALSSAAYLPGAFALLSEGVPQRRQGTAMGLYGLLEDVGLILGPAVAATSGAPGVRKPPSTSEGWRQCQEHSCSCCYSKEKRAMREFVRHLPWVSNAFARYFELVPFTLEPCP